MDNTIVARRIVVGVAELKVSRDAGDSLVALGLGSCLGISVHDPIAGVAGLIHVLLPQAKIDPEQAASNPDMFVDTGVPRLFKECYKLGARKERMSLKVVGGARSSAEPEVDDLFQVGMRNMVVLRKLLWRNGVLIDALEVGGSVSRSLRIDVESGDVMVSSRGSERGLLS